MRHPIYLAWCTLSCVFLFYANHRGFNLLAETFASRGNGAGSHSAGFYHK